MREAAIRVMSPFLKGAVILCKGGGLGWPARWPGLFRTNKEEAEVVVVLKEEERDAPAVAGRCVVLLLMKLPLLLLILLLRIRFLLRLPLAWSKALPVFDNKL